MKDNFKKKKSSKKPIKSAYISQPRKFAKMHRQNTLVEVKEVPTGPNPPSGVSSHTPDEGGKAPLGTDKACTLAKSSAMKRALTTKPTVKMKLEISNMICSG